MIPILDAQKIKEVDQYTIKNQKILSVDLMEIAAAAFFDEIILNYESNRLDQHFTLFCGKGNNGGDGLAVARLMHHIGIKFKIYIVNFTSKASEDFNINLERIYDLGVKPEILDDSNFDFKIEKDSIVIDGIFGSGLNRPIEGFVAQIVQKINQSKEIIAIDIPSGLMTTDNRSNLLENIVQANQTISFQIPKLSFLLPEYAKYVGDWSLVNIGLDENFIQNQLSDYYFIDSSDISSRLKKREKFSHKGTFGHALLISGSHGKMGATVLAAKAALKSGVGLLTIQSPKCGVDTLQTTVPQAMVIPDESEEYLKSLIDYSNFSAIGIGPSIGKNEATVKLLSHLIGSYSKPILIDADALNILSENTDLLNIIPSNSILTPHPGEFERLVGKWKTDEEKIDLQIEFAKKYNVFLVLKGANTSITCPDGKMYFNSTGNAGMAMGGSGDILSGMITALLAQDYNSLDAAMIAVYMHGLAGDIAARDKGQIGMVAEDIIENISTAFKEID